MTDTTNTDQPIIPHPLWTGDILGRFWRGENRRNESIRRAIDLHEQGCTYEQIATRLGYESRMGPYFAVNYSAIAQEHARNRAVGHRDATEAAHSQNPLTDDVTGRTGEMVNESEAA